MKSISNHLLKSAVFTISTLMSVNVLADTWELAWKTTGLNNAESVVYDPARNQLFVSTQNNHQPDGYGSISLVSPDGEVIQKDWVAGMNAPKGVLIQGNKLYVSDVTELIEISIPDAEITNRYTLESTKFLNDVTADEAGNVYVSDMFNSEIYRLDTEGNFELWMQSPELENPNGLLVVGDEIYIGAWGPFDDANPIDAPPGRFLKVSLEDQTITQLTEEPIGALDGLQAYGDGFLLSDWKQGTVFEVSADNTVMEIIDTEQSSGDIAYLPETDTILVPMNTQGEIQAYVKSSTH